MLLGSERFVEEVRSLRVGASPHKEVPQQRKVLASMDPEGFIRRSSVLLGRKREEYNTGQRIHGEVKEDRDVLIYALWKTGFYRNKEIGQLFSISYSAVSHVIANMKRKENDPLVQSKLSKINSQFKM